MAISVSDLLSKLQDYVNTSAGKKKIDDKIMSYRKGLDPKVKSTGRTYGGGVIMTEKQMVSAAKDLISMIRSAAAQEDLPASVMEHIESFDYTLPYITANGSFQIQIYMTDDPKRESLNPNKYGGVDNIVAIFNNGYTANNRIRGEWHGKRTLSLDKRQGSFFMQKAVDSFNAKYGSQFDISVWLNPNYGGAWAQGE